MLVMFDEGGKGGATDDGSSFIVRRSRDSTFDLPQLRLRSQCDSLFSLLANPSHLNRFVIRHGPLTSANNCYPASKRLHPTAKMQQSLSELFRIHHSHTNTLALGRSLRRLRIIRRTI